MTNEIIPTNKIQNCIFNIRGLQVMLDSDLADMYQVSTGRLNEQVKRNIERFPEDFMFQLTEEEWKNLKSQNATSSYDALKSQNATLNPEQENLKSQNETSSWGGRRKLPYVFTEQGISSLSGVLKSDIAVKVNIAIMRAFVEMRKFIATNAAIFQRLDRVEQKQLETDDKVTQIFEALEDKSIKPQQGIFFDGQIFDAYTFVSDLIRIAKHSLVLIDNYVDDSLLTLFTKRNKEVAFHIFTKNANKQLQLDIKKHNQQYTPVTLHRFDKAHDRFLIIDNSEVYHFGASLKDLGKKWFAFSKMDKTSVESIINSIAELL